MQTKSANECVRPSGATEEMRRAYDILEKWVAAVSEKWATLTEHLKGVGLPPCDEFLKIGNPPIARISNKTKELLMVGGRELVHSFLWGEISVEELKNLRIQTMAALSTEEKKIAAERERMVKHEKEFKKALPEMMDEFGADIMTLNGPPKK